MRLIPTVIQKTYEGERSFDIFSRLLEERIIMLTGEVNDELSSLITAQLLYLDSTNQNGEEIYMYINSPGGSITSGMAIYDTMNFIKSDVSTICMGMAASMGAFLLSAGTKGKRYALKNSEIMIHQPSGGASGQASDIEIITKRLIDKKKHLNQILANNTGQSLKTIQKDTDRDRYFKADEALKYGLIDKILLKKE
jgi:Protease subunit of ATP-dependent Clp proteases